MYALYLSFTVPWTGKTSTGNFQVHISSWSYRSGRPNTDSKECYDNLGRKDQKNGLHSMTPTVQREFNNASLVTIQEDGMLSHDFSFSLTGTEY